MQTLSNATKTNVLTKESIYTFIALECAFTVWGDEAKALLTPDSGTAKVLLLLADDLLSRREIESTETFQPSMLAVAEAWRDSIGEGNLSSYVNLMLGEDRGRFIVWQT